MKVRLAHIILIGVACIIIAQPAVSRTPPRDTTKLSHTFLLSDANKRTIDVANQRGKVIFINFWAMTCVPCKEEMPTIGKLKDRYENDTNFLVFPVDLDQTVLEDMAWFRKNNFPLGIYVAASVVPKELFMGELPTTAVIDKTGHIVVLQQGKGEYDTPAFFELVDSLLKQ